MDREKERTVRRDREEMVLVLDRFQHLALFGSAFGLLHQPLVTRMQPTKSRAHGMGFIMAVLMVAKN